MGRVDQCGPHKVTPHLGGKTKIKQKLWCGEHNVVSMDDDDERGEMLYNELQYMQCGSMGPTFDRYRPFRTLKSHPP